MAPRDLRLPTLGLVVAAWLTSAAPSSAEPSTRARATTDELAQLHVVAGAYGVLTGSWIHELGGKRHWSTFAVPAAGASVFSVGTVAWLQEGNHWQRGQPQALVTDSLLGTGIAALWVWHEQARRPEAGWSPELRSTLLWSGATVGAAAGVLRYELSPSAPGQAAFTGSVAWWSGALAGMITGAATPDEERREANASLAAALGMEGGVILGSWLGRTLRPPGGWSIGWVRAVDAGVLLGAVGLGGTYALASGTDLRSRTTLGLGALGLTLGGLGAAWLAPTFGLPRHMHFSVAPELSAHTQGLRLVLLH